MVSTAAPKWVSRNELAEALKIHPVTICRAIAADPLARFQRADEKIDIDVAAKALGSTREFLWNCLAGTDYALRIKDIAKFAAPTDLAQLITFTAILKPSLKYGPRLVRFSGKRTGLCAGKRGKKRAQLIASRIMREAA